MKSASKLFYGLSVFLAVMAAVYIYATGWVLDSGNVINANHGRVEAAGATGLVMSTALTLFLGVYFHFTETRADITPADAEEAEIADGAGTLGFFSASSIWPFAMTMAILILGVGIVFWNFWPILFGGAALIWAATRLNTQYYVPAEDH